MPSDKADKIETNYPNLPTLRLFDEQKNDGQKNEGFARKYDNVFPLDHRSGEAEMAAEDAPYDPYEKMRNGHAVENHDSETGVLEQRERTKLELKTRTEALLTKIKSGSSGANTLNAVDPEQDDEAELETNAPAHSQSSKRDWPPADYEPPQSFSEVREGGQVESASGEPERLRAEIIAKAREAETRAREDERSARYQADYGKFYQHFRPFDLHPFLHVKLLALLRVDVFSERVVANLRSFDVVAGQFS